MARRQGEAAGAETIYGIPVESLVKDASGKICGIRAGEDEISAEVVILCDGVNSLLANDAVGYDKPPASQVAVGVKEVFMLDEKTVSDRLLCADGEGAAWLFVGDATHGVFGGGFMYTNRESISLGVVAGIEACASGKGKPVYQMLEDLKNHPSVAPLIHDAKVVEHSGHMVPEGGVNIMPPLTGDGVMLAGDSAMMCINLGYMVRGMDYAIAAGQLAGQQAARAIDSGDTSKAGLQGYVDALESTFVMEDLRRYKDVPAFLENFDRMFGLYPQAAANVMDALFLDRRNTRRAPQVQVEAHYQESGRHECPQRCERSPESAMSENAITVNVDEYLAVNKYEVDEGNPHITLADDLDDAEFDKLVKVCPAALYKRDEDGARSFDYAGCLECGTCRVLCEGTVVSKWKFPEATMGVEYRFG